MSNKTPKKQKKRRAQKTWKMGEIINENKKQQQQGRSEKGGEGGKKRDSVCFFLFFFRSFQGSLTFVPPIERCCRAGQGRTITSIIILYDDGDDDADEADDEDDDDDIARYRCNCWHFDAENRVFYTKTLDHA